MKVQQKFTSWKRPSFESTPTSPGPRFRPIIYICTGRTLSIRQKACPRGIRSGAGSERNEEGISRHPRAGIQFLPGVYVREGRENAQDLQPHHVLCELSRCSQEVAAGQVSVEFKKGPLAGFVGKQSSNTDPNQIPTSFAIDKKPCLQEIPEVIKRSILAVFDTPFPRV